MYKLCKVCNTEKPLEEMATYNNSKAKGYRKLCIDCKRAQDRHYTNNVRDRDKQYAATLKWMRANPEKVAGYNRKHYEKVTSTPELREKYKAQQREKWRLWYAELKKNPQKYQERLERDAARKKQSYQEKKARVQPG